MDPTRAQADVEFSDSLAAALADREALQLQAAAGGVEPPTEFGAGSPASQVSPKAYALTVKHETGGRAHDEHVYKGRLVWPGAASGVTTGFGYDLARSNNRCRIAGSIAFRG